MYSNALLSQQMVSMLCDALLAGVHGVGHDLDGRRHDLPQAVWIKVHRLPDRTWVLVNYEHSGASRSEVKRTTLVILTGTPTAAQHATAFHGVIHNTRVSS